MSRKNYVGKDLTVGFDLDVCQHSGNCLQGLPAVFDTDRHPWIDPDDASREEVVAQVARYPSGSLRIEDRQNDT